MKRMIDVVVAVQSVALVSVFVALCQYYKNKVTTKPASIAQGTKTLVKGLVSFEKFVSDYCAML